jgi:predicted N-acyltransferase
MNDYEIFYLTDSDKWNKYLKMLPREMQDIYFTPEYYSLYENNNDGKAFCFFYNEGDNIALYPFLKNSIRDLGYDLDKEYYDIQGAYGYNGVLTNNTSQTFLHSFFDCVNEFCKQNNIIAEFLRINPILQNPLLFRTNFELIYDRDNINVNLLNDNVYETEYEYSTRKNIQKAKRSGLTYKWVFGNGINDTDLELFRKIYYYTMDRNGADSYYYFGTDFFNNILKYLGKNSLFVFVLIDGQVISCELVMLGKGIAYSFLGGTLSDYYQYRPNDFLKHETIKLLKVKGFSNFLLGGGSEGVFKYKKSFSKNGVVPFYIGKKIHNQKIYDSIIQQWSQKKHSESNRLLKYREISDE